MRKSDGSQTSGTERMSLEEAIAQKTNTRARGNPEMAEQIALFNWLKAMSAKYPDLAKPYAIPNGEKRDKITAARLKAAGVKAGVWDIFCPRGKVYDWNGLYIEMKAPGKYKPPSKGLTDAQRTFRSEDTEFQYSFHVFDSWVEAAKHIAEFYGVPRDVWENL